MTEANLAGTTLASPTSYSINPDAFVSLGSDYLHYCFNRVKKWNLSISFKVLCPNDVHHEFQTFTGGTVFDRSTYFPEETDLHAEPQVLYNGTDPGRDFWIFEEPTAAGTVSNILRRVNDSGLIDTGPTFFQFYFMGACVVGDWGSPLAAGLMCEARLSGIPWQDVSGGEFTAISFLAGDNTLGFEGADPTHFRLVGNLEGGAFVNGYPSRSIDQFEQDYHVIMTPSEWYEYDSGDGPRFDSATGEPI